MTRRHVTRTAAARVPAALLLAGSLTAVTTAAPPVAARRFEAGSLPLAREIDERFQSFQVGFPHLTGGETWKSYN
jgi:hypothetical protein